jgi:hypothetical protein
MFSILRILTTTIQGKVSIFLANVAVPSFQIVESWYAAAVWFRDLAENLLLLSKKKILTGNHI